MKSRTRKLVRFVLSGAEEEGADTELLDLHDRKIEACTACDACALTGKCVFDDDFLSIVQMMRLSDGIVLGSPVYIDNVSGQMKIFVDRLADSIHYQVLTGKYGCAVATTWSSGGEEVVSYLNHVINYLGAQALPGMWVALEDDEQAIYGSEERARQLGRNLVRAISAGTRFPEQLRIIEENRAFFASIVTANSEWRREEYDEWVKRGWI
ncbi:MAG: flavodoxin family protein [Methanoregulaceae archaeon]|nr:flavodoxin family protein [Methanoregulaceae archaeon]